MGVLWKAETLQFNLLLIALRGLLLGGEMNKKLERLAGMLSYWVEGLLCAQSSLHYLYSISSHLANN